MRRLDFLFLTFFLAMGLIVYRLFYWQIQAGEKLAILAESQQTSKIELPAKRGRIFSAEHFPLVANQEAYLVYADLTQIDKDPAEMASQLAPVLTDEAETATDSMRLLKNTEAEIKSKLASENRAWVILKHKAKKEVRQAIEALGFAGLGFQEESLRFYPEASMSGHLLGFLGSDASGNDQGYFGLEGYYDLELKGRSGYLYQENDASGKPILLGRFEEEEAFDGRDLVLHLDRAVQFIVEEALQSGIEKYGARSGSVVVMEPATGAILAMTSWPKYEPQFFQQFDQVLFKNPVVADSFEPGSIFKVIVMAAALNEKLITPETRCDACSGPKVIGPDTVHTYDDRYYPETTVSEILTHSDNVGMVFIAEKLGLEKMWRYLNNFGFGELSGIDLQEEITPEIRSEEEWRPIDLAAASFGQGIAVTPIQMVRAAAVIANGGQLVTPQVVQAVIAEDKKIKINPKIIRRVISQEAAKTLTAMMVNAIDNGFPHWQQYGISGWQIAGKCGTAQIPLAGHYDKEKTIASFVGFAPAYRPQFVMLVTLREPTSSSWGANTAAPLWFEIAKKLFFYYGLSPKR